MKHACIAALLLLMPHYVSAQAAGGTTDAKATVAPSITALRAKKWHHGSADCKAKTDPAIEVFRYDPTSFVLRQNKCLSFEAPFIYVLIGDDKALVLDTGATESALDFPLYKTVRSLLDSPSGRPGNKAIELLVVHTHSHRDHHSGDSQFKGKPGTTVVEPNHEAMLRFFAFRDWPNGHGTMELGGRKLIVLPTPGHQEESVSIYDPRTQWLLTGDTLYPGYVYVKHWDQYKASIARLASFSETHDISAVLGAHIEMTDKAGEYYPIGTIYQPDEAALPLTRDNLTTLNAALQKAKKAQKIATDDFIIVPMNALQKAISNISRWILN